MCGFRDPFLYHDNDVYYEYFKGDYLANGEGTINFGYFFFNILVSSLTSKFQVFCFIISFVVIWSYSRTILKYSPYIGLSLLLYFLINYYPSYFLLRQYMAMPFVFLAYKYVIKREQKKYLICVLLAFSMHSMAICVLPLYYLYGIKYSKRNFILIMAGTIGTCSLFVVIGKLLISFVPTYHLYLEDAEMEPSWQRALMSIYLMMTYLYCFKNNCYHEGLNRLVFFTMLMCVIICVGGVNLVGAFRLKDFYSFAEFVGIPLIFYNCKFQRPLKKFNLYIMTSVYIVLLFILFTRFVDGGNMSDGYSFFWNHK